MLRLHFSPSPVICGHLRSSAFAANDPEAEITRLKDGRTALAYKAEQAVDMQTGAIVAVATHGGAGRCSSALA